jgi:acyl-homoserine-lactone acylase
MFVFILAHCLGALAAEGPVTVTFTEHGIPHIQASSYFGLGYGYAYAAAKIDVCALAEVFVEARGQRALYFGGDSSEMSPFAGQPVSREVSDLATNLLVDDDELAVQRAGLAPDVRDLVSGYAEGFNRYLLDTPRNRLPKGCMGADWVKPITGDDVLRRVASALTLTGFFDQELFNAQPPSSRLSLFKTGQADQTAGGVDAGSNGYAFGGSRTSNGSGLLLGNPHWFWTGSSHFMEAHLILPGKYDVLGASVIGMPLITLGFNRSMAWTHTVATDARGTIFELTLDPSDATHYLIDGRSIAMHQKKVTVQGRQTDGTVKPVSHVFWITSYGPVVESPQLPWSKTTAYALADANAGNNRYLDQLLEIGAAPDVETLKTQLAKTMGLVWLNTLAADAKGDALFADMSVTPDVPASVFETCKRAVTFPQARFVNVMDGSRIECQWRDDARAPQKGIMPGALKPLFQTRDYVENSNSSHWLVNPVHPLEGFSPIIGPERSVPNVRTRQGHMQVSDRVSNRDGLGGSKFDMGRLESDLFSNRDYLAELVLDDLLDACARTPLIKMPDGSSRDLTQACSILRRWDRKDNLASVGAQVFREFARQERAPGEEDPAAASAFWRVPFDPDHPLDTPRGLNISTQAPLEALARAVDRLEKAQIPLDSRLGDIQFIDRNGERIPLHGGLIFNRISLTLKPGVGYTEPIGSADSYIQVVTFDQNEPVADILLVNSQSSDPDSPWFADQAKLYSQKQWVRVPFTAAQIASHAIGPPLVLSIHAKEDLEPPIPF